MQATNRPKKNHLFKTSFSSKRKAPKPQVNDIGETELLPTNESLSKCNNDYDRRTKYISKTIHRWLKSHTHRPWNKILTEIQEKFGNDSQQIIKEVETHSYRDEKNQIVIMTEYGPKTVSDYVFQFYVTPEGLLAHKPRKKYKYNKTPTVLMHGEFLWFRLNGLVFKAALDQSEPGEGFTLHPVFNPLRTTYEIIYQDPKSSHKKGQLPQENRRIPATHIRQASAKETHDLRKLLPTKEIEFKQ